MAKKLLVRTPQTVDGVNLKYDANERPVYKETIVELKARKSFESINTKLPTILKHKLIEVEVDGNNKVISQQATAKAVPANKPKPAGKKKAEQVEEPEEEEQETEEGIGGEETDTTTEQTPKRQRNNANNQ